MTWDQNSIVRKFGARDAERLKSQKSFIFEPIGRQSLCSVSKNQLSKSIREGDMIVFSLFYLKKRLSLPFKLIQEVEIWYVDLVEAVNMPFWNYDFSDSLRFRIAQECGTLGGFSYALSLFLVNSPPNWARQLKFRL